MNLFCCLTTKSLDVDALNGCFEGNFENNGRMEMFSILGESDLVRSFMFGQGRIQIPSLVFLFDSVI